MRQMVLLLPTEAVTQETAESHAPPPHLNCLRMSMDFHGETSELLYTKFEHIKTQFSYLG